VLVTRGGLRLVGWRKHDVGDDVSGGPRLVDLVHRSTVDRVKGYEFIFIGKIMHTTQRLQENLCTQLVVREKNIHTSYSSSSCAHKLYAQVLVESNLCLKIIRQIL
jgi:hypothetical protein